VGLEWTSSQEPHTVVSSSALIVGVRLDEQHSCRAPLALPMRTTLPGGNTALTLTLWCVHLLLNRIESRRRRRRPGAAPAPPRGAAPIHSVQETSRVFLTSPYFCD